MPYPLEYITIILTEIFFIGACIGAAYIEKNFFKYNHTFKHWWGLAGYTILVIVCFLLFRNILLCIAAYLIAEVIFSPFLNWIRGLKFFYTNTEDPNGSELDKVEKGISRPLYFLSCLALIILNLIFFKDAIFPSGY